MMASRAQVEIPDGKIVEFCKRNYIRKFSLFGSVLSEAFRPDSDVDVLVEFEEGHVPGFVRLAGMEIELSEIIGRKVDINTPNCLSRYFRGGVFATAEVHYAKG
jgi:predicted nucleotidyltransferase